MRILILLLSVTSGLLGRGWATSWDQSWLRVPNLAEGWESTWLMLAQQPLNIQETQGHRVTVVLPDGGSELFKAAPDPGKASGCLSEEPDYSDIPYPAAVGYYPVITQTRGAYATVSHYGYDGLGSVRFLAGSSGSITDTYTYDAYGTLIASTETNINFYRFTGEQWDPDLGMCYLRARYLSPGYGRFWTMDSYEGNNQDPLSLHKYLYVHDSPVNLTDPSGHDPLSSAINGQLVHKRIAQDFVSKVPGGISGPAVSTVLGNTYPGTYFPTILMYPDLIDVPGKQIYEIKAFRRWLDGKLQLTGYVGAFNYFDPAKGWSAGSTYMPPSKIYLGALSWAIVYPTSGGVIMYDVIDVPALAMVSVGVVASVRNVDINTSFDVATLNSLMGAL